MSLEQVTELKSTIMARFTTDLLILVLLGALGAPNPIASKLWCFGVVDVEVDLRAVTDLFDLGCVPLQGSGVH